MRGPIIVQDVVAGCLIGCDASFGHQTNQSEGIPVTCHYHQGVA